MTRRETFLLLAAACVAPRVPEIAEGTAVVMNPDWIPDEYSLTIWIWAKAIQGSGEPIKYDWESRYRYREVIEV